MKLFEMAATAVLAAFGIRAIVYWARRPFAGTDVVDHLLYAVHLTGRVGLWFAFAAMFMVFGASDAEGRAFADEMNDQQWLLYLIVALGVMQLLGGWFLSRRLPSPPGEGSGDAGAGR